LWTVKHAALLMRHGSIEMSRNLDNKAVGAFSTASDTRASTLLGDTGVLLAIVLVGVRSASAAGLELSAELTLTTDYVFRGVSQTMSAPALQGSLNVSHEIGFFAYVWGSNVDYVADGDPDDGADTEVDVLVGYSREISDRIAVTASWVRYSFPGMKDEIRYDFHEWTGEVTVDDRYSVTVAWSPDVFGSGGSSLYYSASTVFDLPANLLLALELGRYDLRKSYGESYDHAAASITGSLDPLRWTLGYHLTSGDAKTIFQESTVAPEFVLSFSVSF
jgi:uncharacterized protein (TIGR02001 family)